MRASVWEVSRVFLKLRLTSVGARSHTVAPEPRQPTNAPSTLRRWDVAQSSTMLSRCPARRIGLHESRLIYDTVMTDAYAMGYEAHRLRDISVSDLRSLC